MSQALHIVYKMLPCALRRAARDVVFTTHLNDAMLHTRVGSRKVVSRTSYLVASPGVHYQSERIEHPPQIALMHRF